MSSIAETKHALYIQCVEAIKSRVENAQAALSNAREAGASDDKNSAGDKYETGREMMKQEEDKAAKQLSEAAKLLAALQQLNLNRIYESAEAGSLVITNQASYFLSISAGKLVLDGKPYVAMAAGAPLAQKMLGLGVGDQFSFNGRSFEILEIG